MRYNEWKEVKLGDVINFNPRERIIKKQIAKKIAMNKLKPFTKFIDNYELAEFSGGTKFKNGDTLLARITPCLENGKTSQVSILDDNEVGFGSTEYIVLRGKVGITDIDYIYYLSISPNFRDIAIKSMVGSSGRQRVQQDELENLEILLPPIDEQKSIADTLSCLDDKIELNKKINDNLIAQIQSLYQELIAEENWPLCAVEDVASKIAMGPFGSNIKVETFVPSGIPIISGNHLRGFFLDEPSYNFVTEAHALRLKNSIVYPDDIIFTHAGNIGQVALIPEGCDYRNYVISQRQFYLRCDKTKVIPEYVLFFFHSRDGQGKLLANANSTGVPSIAQPSTHLKKIEIPLPPISRQQNWLNLITPMKMLYVANSSEIKKLSNLRDYLLPKLLSGEINVKKVIN